MKDKVVVITGASSGIGLACAKEFTSAGAKVVLAARHEDKLQLASGKLQLAGNNELTSERTADWRLPSADFCLTVVTDVSKQDDCKKLIDETIKHYGRLDVLINNAGISMRALFEEVDLKVLHELMDINFWGTVYCTKYALPYLLKAKGSVVGMSSIAGKKGLPGRTGYSASKFAIEGFLETLRIENLKKDLHVLVACPGFTTSNIRNTALSKDGTAQGESPRDENNMMSADEVAKRIYKAVIHRRRDLVLTSNGKLTVLLNKFFPAFMDKMVYNHMAKEADSPFK